MRTLGWVLACALVAAPARAQDLDERLVRIRAFDSQDKFRGCGAGYLTHAGQIVTAYHVLVPPGATWCGVPQVGDPNIVRYQIRTHDGKVVDVKCGEMVMLPPGGKTPLEDVGFLRVLAAKARPLEVSNERVDGFVNYRDFQTQDSAAIVGYLDDQCKEDRDLPSKAQSVQLSQPRPPKPGETAGEFIVIPLPESPGTSGSPVVWKATDTIVGIYVREQEVASGEGRKGLISPFDAPLVRASYRDFTGEDLSEQTLTPKRTLLGAGLAVGKPFGADSSAFGGGGVLAWEQWAYRGWSIGFAASAAVFWDRFEWEYRDPLGRRIDHASMSKADVSLGFMPELRVVRGSWIHPLFGLGARLDWLPKLPAPPGMDSVHWMFGAAGRVGLEARIKGSLWLRVVADAWYGWIPNTTVQYTGRGAELEYVDGQSTRTAFTLQSASAIALSFD